MIIKIIEILNTEDFTDVSEIIDIAKGKYKHPESIQEARQKIKRFK